MNLDVALDQRGRALHGADIRGQRIDGRLVFKVGAAEFEPVVNRRRKDGESDFLAGVQGNSGQRGRARKGVLFLHRGS